MKLKALAVDYDGTLTLNGRLSPSVIEVLADVRRRGVSILLVTGRRLDHLRADTNVQIFDAVVAENGAVVEFPSRARCECTASAPPQAFMDLLAQRGVPFVAGQVVVEMDGDHAHAALSAIRDLQLPLQLVFNRSRLMVLPPGVAKASGLHRALFQMRLSVHNTVGIGDAENDHDLLNACEAGLAVQWGSPALCATADDVIPGSDPAALPPYIERLVARPRIPVAQAGRRRICLGTTHTGQPQWLTVRGRNILIAGEPGSGKSFLAGTICEQLILQRYSVAILDPEGDYRALGELPDVTVLGGDDPPPRVREIMQALRHPGESIVIDLSRVMAVEKREYVRSVLHVLAQERRASGLPHKILLDEAHQFLCGGDPPIRLDHELGGYICVTYRASELAPQVAPDAVIIVTREHDEGERAALTRLCRAELPPDALREIPLAEAALLPGPDEAGGRVLRFRIEPRLTSHVRHRQKYYDMPVGESHAFYFTRQGVVTGRARSLREFIDILQQGPPDRFHDHLVRHDFSRWIRDVFRDGVLAADLHRLESRVIDESAASVTGVIVRAVRGRYDIDTVQSAPDEGPATGR